MVNRRSLTPDEQSLLEIGETAKAEPTPKSPAEAISKKENSPMASPALKKDFAQPASVPIPPSTALPPFTMAGAVSLNVRIEPEISTALLGASMDRIIQQLDPFPQRDIVAEALADWLRKNGYLG